jgi:hypothetical protein
MIEMIQGHTKTQPAALPVTPLGQVGQDPGRVGIASESLGIMIETI